jgi:hypothetical protein
MACLVVVLEVIDFFGSVIPPASSTIITSTTTLSIATD